MAFYRRLLPSASKASSTEPKTPKSWSWKRLGKTVLVLGVSLVALGVFAFTVLAAWVSRDLPDPNSLATREVAQSTKIYDRTGTQLLYEIHGDEKRTLVKIQDIPEVMKQATISIEDKKFYEHHGIYWRGLARAVVMSVVKGQRLQGTSTLTQQYVKNAVLTNERSYIRKLREFLLALQIERTYSKDQILQLYLNEIPYGSNIYGVESASQTYFGKSARDLSLDEAALLAAIPQRPDFFSPYGAGTHGDNRERLVVRQHYILDLMGEQGYVTKDQAEQAKLVDTLKKIQPKSLGDIRAPHFVMYVRSQLVDKYGQRTVEQGGLKVITTLDWNKQKIAEEEVKKGVDARGKSYKFNNAALVSLDPKTGQVLAMVGSKDYFDAAIDGNVNVTLRPRQPGSSFKPIAYAVGFMRGYLPQTQLWDVNTAFKTDAKDYEPKDYDLKERGPISVRQALQGSLNIPAVQMLYLAGIGRVLDFADALGYTTLQDRSRYGLALVLGGGEVKPIEHAAAFGAFAIDGISMPTASILHVEDTNGHALEDWAQPEGTRVMEPQIARLINDVLSDNGSRAYVFGANNALTLPDRPVAAKTGTTNNYHDAWTAGYTPNLVTVVWVGNTKNEEMRHGADGSIIAAPIWQGYMKRATKGMAIERFPAPDGPSVSKPALLGTAFTKRINVDKMSGLLATELTPPEFVEERTFYDPHSILYYVDKDDPTGPPPANPATDPQFNNWEMAVRAWVQKNNWHLTETIPTQSDNTHTPENQPIVSIVQPFDGQTITDRAFTVTAYVQARRSISRLEAYVDGSIIGATSVGTSFTVVLPPQVGDGSHDFVVVAIDDVGNRGQSSIRIQVQSAPQPIVVPVPEPIPQPIIIP